MTPLFLKIKYNIITFNQADIDVAKANPTCLYSSIRSKLKNKFANKAIKPTLTGVLVSSLEKKITESTLIKIKAGKPKHSALKDIPVNLASFRENSPLTNKISNN